MVKDTPYDILYLLIYLGKENYKTKAYAKGQKHSRQTRLWNYCILFTEIWEKEDVPSAWRDGYLIKLPKKGDLSNCSNYRGITLLSVPGKVFNRIILERMKGEMDPWLRDQQAGFCPNRSDCNTTHYSRAILGMELPTLHQLC